MVEVLFFLAGIGAVTGAIGVVALRNPFYSVLALVSHLVSLAALFLLLNAEFVAAAQVVVYAGAVMVLYVFVVAYVGGADVPLGPQAGRGLRIVAASFGAMLFIELVVALLGTGLKAVDSGGPTLDANFGSANQIGELLLTKFLVAFEVASFLLLIAAVGAVVLARRRGGLTAEEDQARYSAMDLLRPTYTGTMAEAVGRRAIRPNVPALPVGEEEDVPLDEPDEDGDGDGR
jgi:NADH:ubiquinone oxidoreductase subunit 6 (subunit J)